MVFIKGGTFTIGSRHEEPKRYHNETQHSVTLSDFYIGKYEVSFDEYDKYCTATGNEKPSDCDWGRGTHPVIYVSWYDAVEYCNWLSQKQNLSTYYKIDKINKDENNTNSSDDLKWTITTNSDAKGYRLPTEAEWEYACRARAATPFNTGNNLTTSQANYNGNHPYNGNAIGEFRQRTTPCGTFAPNAWGLYDMHGNVWEWCSDWYEIYTSERQVNPKGADTGCFRVMRGAGWVDYAEYCRSASRSIYSPNNRHNSLGFRLVRVP